MHVCMVDLNNILCFGDGSGKCEFLVHIRRTPSNIPKAYRSCKINTYNKMYIIYL